MWKLIDNNWPTFGPYFLTWGSLGPSYQLALKLLLGSCLVSLFFSSLIGSYLLIANLCIWLYIWFSNRKQIAGSAEYLEKSCTVKAQMSEW